MGNRKLTSEQIDEIIKVREDNSGRLKMGQLKEFSKRFGVTGQTIYQNTDEDIIKKMKERAREKSELVILNRGEEILNLIKERTNEEMIVVVSKKIIDTLREKNFAYTFTKKWTLSYAGAIYYLACRKLNLPENLRNIQEKFNIEKMRYIHDRVITIKKAIGMNYCDKASIMGTSCLMVHSPERYIEKLCDTFKFSNELRNECLKISDELKESIYTSPEGISCAIVFIVSKQNGLGLTQREVVDTLGISEVTIRNNIKKIEQVLKEITK